MSIADLTAPEPVRYLDPYAESGDVLDAYEPRLVDPDRARIGLFSNMFVDATVFLDDIGVVLARRYPGMALKSYDKGHSASIPATAELVARIRSECDAVILAYGHCGSCTASVVQDAVALARAGLPVATLVTEKFVDEAQFIARVSRMPDVPFVYLPHPIAGEPAEFHRAVAEEVVPLAVRALTAAVSDKVSMASLHRAAA